MFSGKSGAAFPGGGCGVFFEEEGIDMDGADEDEILNADEVFEIGDGRYLIVEG